MRVVVITSYDDHQSGMGPTAVVEKPAAMDVDDVFVWWLKRNHTQYKRKSRDKCLEALYAWEEHPVVRVSDGQENDI